MQPPKGFASAIALLAYVPEVQKLVLAAKNGNRRDLLGWAAGELIRESTSAGSNRLGEIDVVTWMPASSEGLRRRGYDQGYVLARAVAKTLGLPCQRLVTRKRGESQIGRSRLERLAGPKLSSVKEAPPRVLVVDDVVTTGGSAAALALVVAAAGAQQVHLATVAAVERP